MENGKNSGAKDEAIEAAYIIPFFLSQFLKYIFRRGIMKAVSLTKVRIFLPIVLCIIVSGFASKSYAPPEPPDMWPCPIDPNFTYESELLELDSFSDILKSIEGDDEIARCNTVSKGDVFIPGIGNYPATLTGPFEIETFGIIGHTTGTFDTEILSMSLSGEINGNDILMRESPTLSSTGLFNVELGDNCYMVDSFFDIFFEISIDGGNTWIPQEGSSHFELTPEPATVCLLVLGSMAVLKRRRR